MSNLQSKICSCVLSYCVDAARQSEIKQKCVNFVSQVYFHFTTEGNLVDKIDLQTLFLNVTYCHKKVQDYLAVKILDIRL